MSTPDSRDQHCDPHHPKGTQPMTDNTIPADKVQEVIDFLIRHSTEGAGDYAIGYSSAIVYCISMLRGIVHLSPRTLADELSEYAENILGGGSVSDVKRQLILFADRVETLEQERDEAQDMEGRATANLSIQVDRAERLSEELAEARVTVEEQAAEIARLRAREIPDGWRIAEHPEYGTVIANPKEDSGGYVVIRYLNENQFVESCFVSAHALSFRDEASEPQPEPEHIDPKSCGRYDWYLIKYSGHEYHGIRIDPTDRVYAWGVISPDDRFESVGDADLTVLRPLTLEEIFDDSEEKVK